MRTIVIAVAMCMCVVSSAASVSADTLILRDGTRVQGTLVSFVARTITFRHADGVSRRYATSAVGSVEFASAERPNPHAIADRTLEAPAGTEWVVRTVEAIDPRSAGANQTFSGIVEQDVTNAAGRVIVPANSRAYLTIRAVAADGATGRSELTLAVESIAVNGRRYFVSAPLVRGGPDVSAPAETVLRFRVDRVVTLQLDR